MPPILFDFSKKLIIIKKHFDETKFKQKFIMND